MKKAYLFTFLIISFIILDAIINNNTIITQFRNKYHGVNVYRSSAELINASNSALIDEYDNGNKHVMYTYEVTDTINAYRFIGRQANNYIYFNCENDMDYSTCEVWRIIGVFKVEDANGVSKYRVKIMRDEPIGTYKWSEESNQNWENSLIKNELDTYYDNLSAFSKSLIAQTKYNVNAFNNSNYTNFSSFYTSETSGNDTWTGYLGLIYPSDYLYTFSKNADNEFASNTNYKKSWMYRLSDSAWTMSQTENLQNTYYTINDSIGSTNGQPSNEYDVYPVAYLKYNTAFFGGNGSKINPYVVQLFNDSNIQSENDVVNKGDYDLDNVVIVGDTFSTTSIIILIISFILIIGGITILVTNYIKSKKSR